MVQENCVKNKILIMSYNFASSYFEEIKKEHPNLTKGYGMRRILPYIENAPDVIAASDIVISRCGAMTIAELAACGTAAILIPSPNVANDHQYKNAKMLTDKGAAILIRENELTDGTLLSCVRALTSNKNQRKMLGEKIRGFYSANAKEKIEKEIIVCIKGH